jgi:hypothetical protein
LNHLSEINLAKTTNAAAVAKGEAYKGLQDFWFHVVRESQPGAKALVRKADESFARLEPVAKAAESVMKGPWNPARMHTVNTRTKIEASPLDKALQASMGDLKYKSRFATAASSTGRAAINIGGLSVLGDIAQNFGVHGAGPTTVIPLLGLSALGTYGLGSKGGMGYLTRGVNPVLEFGSDRGQQLANIIRAKAGKAIKPVVPYDEAAMDEWLRSITQQGVAEYGRK